MPWARLFTTLALGYVALLLAHRGIWWGAAPAGVIALFLAYLNGMIDEAWLAEKEGVEEEAVERHERIREETYRKLEGLDR